LYLRQIDAHLLQANPHLSTSKRNEGIKVSSLTKIDMEIRGRKARCFAFAFGVALWLLFVGGNGASQTAERTQAAASQAASAQTDPAKTASAQANTATAPSAQTQTASSDPTVKPAPATPIAVKKVELGKPSWDPKWDKAIEDAVPPEFLSSRRVARDAKPLCPRYRHLSDVDKKQFWAYFFQALAGAEAGLEPTSNVRHNDPAVAVRDPVTRHIVRQEGLLQLAYMDADRYGCDFDWEKDKNLPARDPEKTILQPENNLLCGMKILSNQLLTRRWPLLTRKSYWITLQPGTLSFQVFLKQMANVPDVCREPASMEEAGTKREAAAHPKQAAFDAARSMP
jgi:hypothetical protein